jgi:acetyl-CoA C-acetyltransferase
MYVTGVGRTKFGVLREEIPLLLYEAMQNAVKDANINIRDIDAIFIGNFGSGIFQGQIHLNSLVSSILPGMNIPIITIETACASSASALYQAILALSRYESVMVLGVEKMTNVNSNKVTENLCMASDRNLDQKEGLIFPAGYALIAQQHMLRYGTTLDDLSLISMKNHENANKNKYAHFYHKKVDLDMIKNSPIVCSPLRLFDCSPISDGATAAIISKKRRNERDIEIAASSMSTDTISLSEREDLTSFTATKIAAKKAYGQSKLKPDDIDILEVHDCFTISELIALEDLGFCKKGESNIMIRDGKTRIGGFLPVNTDGGLKADGHPIGATGLAQIFEIVTQLRGEAGSRQVKNAKVGLTQSIGGVGGTCVVHILKQ